MKRDFILNVWQFFVNSIIGSVLIPKRIRKILYRLCGIDTNTRNINSSVFFYGNKIKIGAGSLINRECHIFNYDQVTIEDNCFLAPQVMLCTVTHEIGDSIQRAGKFVSKPITIKKGSWLGARVTVMPGVTINEGCIIAAGAVVTKDCMANGLYVGVPAKRKEDLLGEPLNIMAM